MNHKVRCSEEEFNPEEYEGGYTEWELVKQKSVKDTDGFYTDYNMWYNEFEDKYVFTFGDSDIYYPENSDADWECENREEAEEWFNSYESPDDEEDVYSSEGSRKLDATEIVQDMYRNFPNVNFIGEVDLDNSVNLMFECKSDPKSNDEEFDRILEKIDSYGYDYEYDDNNRQVKHIQINGVPEVVEDIN